MMDKKEVIKKIEKNKRAMTQLKDDSYVLT